MFCTNMPYINIAGLDAVVTQLLGQLENSGPPPLPRDQIDSIAAITVTQEQVAANTACSVCWENFQLGERELLDDDALLVTSDI